MAGRMPLLRLHRPPGASQGLRRFRRSRHRADPTTALPDIPNDLWFLAGGPPIFGGLLEPLPASSAGAASTAATLPR
jgi:hypothetical protein